MENQKVRMNIKKESNNFLGAFLNREERQPDEMPMEGGFSFSGGSRQQFQEDITIENKNENPMVKILDKLATISIFMMFFGIPLFFTGLSFQGIVFEKQIYFYLWLFLGLVFWTAKGVVNGEMNIKRTPLDIPIIAFWAIYLFSTILSVDKWHSFFGSFVDPSRGFVNITCLILAYYLINSYFSIQRLKLMMVAIVSSGFIVSIWSFLLLMKINFLPVKAISFVPLSLIGSISGLGIFFSLMLPLILTAIFKLKENAEIKKSMKTILMSLLIFNLFLDMFILLIIFDFVSWIALLIGMGAYLMYILSKVVRPEQSFVWIPMVVFVVILSFLMIGKNQISRIDLPMDVMPNNKLSFDISKEALKNDFVIGSGPATYGYVFSLYKPQYFNLNYLYNLRFYQGKGMFFEYVSTIGILGTILLILLALSFLSVIIYLISKEKERNKVYSLGFSIATFIFLLNSIITRVEGTMLILGCLLASIAVAVVFKESETRENYLKLSLKASPKFALALAFIFMVISAGVTFLFVFFGKIYIADIYAGLASRQNQIIENNSVIKLSKAVEFNPKEGRYYTRIGQEYMVLANNEMMKDEKVRDINKVSDYLNKSIEAVSRGKDLLPKDILAIEALAQIYENTAYYVADSMKLAEENYNNTLKLEPNNPVFYLKLAQIKINSISSKSSEEERKGMIEEAKNLLQKSVDLKQNFDAGYYNLSLIQKALGDLDGSIENMKKAVSINSNDVNYVFNLGQLYQIRAKNDDEQIAEAIYKKILEVQPNQIDTHFNLGYLYEKQGKKNEAISEYQIVESLLPSGTEDLKAKIAKMVSNIKNGIKNSPENLVVNQPESKPENNQAEAAPAPTPPIPNDLNQVPAPAQ